MPKTQPASVSLFSDGLPTLPKISVKGKNKEAQFEAYVNAYIVGKQKIIVNSTFAHPLYYLSLVAMRGQGTLLQGIFAQLVSTHVRNISLEGIGDIVLAHHRFDLSSCGYTLHWNFEQAEIQPSRDLHAVIESRMLTVCDPVQGLALKQRETRHAKLHPGASEEPASASGVPARSGKREKAHASLSTVKQRKLLYNIKEIRQREKHPMFMLMVPGWSAGSDDPTVVERLHLAFLDPRLTWPLDPSWSSFLWARGIARHEIERLSVWSYAPPTLPETLLTDTYQQAASTTPRPLFTDAYFCRPNPAAIAQDLEQALSSGRIGLSTRAGSAPLVSLPSRSPEHDLVPALTATAS